MSTPAANVELVPLGERTGVLHGFRLAMVATVLGAALVVPETLGAPLESLAPVTAVYALVTVMAEWGQRAAKSRALTLVGAALLADGLWISAVVTRTGGPGSLLLFLVVLHVVAVTLLASYRTGLKIAVWHSLLFVVAHYARSTDLIPDWKAPASGGAVVTSSAVASGVVTFLAFAIGTAAFSSLNERELRRRRSELRQLAAMGSELQEVRSAEQVVLVLLHRIVQTFPFPRVAVVLGGEERVREVWLARRSLDTDEDVVRLGSWNARPEGVLLKAWRERRLQLVRRLDEDSPVLSTALPDARNVVVVPMVAEGRPVGAMAVERGGGLGSMISLSRVNALAEFAAHAAVSLRSVCLLAEVERLARVDDLTGLPNRRALEETLPREVARAERSGEPLSVVLLDVDRFKEFNDTYGHQHGDEVLRFVGQVLTSMVREVDLACRYGGEEFLLVLPDCPVVDAAALAERVRHSVASCSEGLGLTVSAGVATLPVHAGSGEGLVWAADRALYESKRTGRNQVTVASAEEPLSAAGLWPDRQLSEAKFS